MTYPLRIVSIALASMTVLATPSLPTGSVSAPVISCESSKDCPSGHHCAGVAVPNAPGISLRTS